MQEGIASRVRIIAGFALIGLFLGGFGCQGTDPEVAARYKPITLKYWRVFDGSDSMDAIVAAYRALHPNITIDYRRLRYDEYEKAVLNAMAEDQGPDLLSLHNTWLREWQPRLLPAPAAITLAYRETVGTIKKDVITVLRTTPGPTIKQLTNDFLDVVAKDVIIPMPQSDTRAPAIPRIYGLPLAVDTPVLFFNRDILNDAGIAQPAGDWKTFQNQVKKITRLDEAGNIVRSAAAFGTADNVERSPDFLALLMMQNGTKMTDEAGRAVFDKIPAELAGRQLAPSVEALIFYSDFANPVKEVYTWNAKMSGSLEAFARGETAFFFGYSYHLAAIRQLNPKLNFGVSPMPQINEDAPVNFANYWVESVSNKTEYPDEAWDFLQFATKAQQAQSYLKVTNKPTALRSLVNGQLQDIDLAPFASQLPSAKSWYHGRDADAAEEALKEMLRQMLVDGSDPAKLLELAASKVNQTIQ